MLPLLPRAVALALLLSAAASSAEESAAPSWTFTQEQVDGQECVGANLGRVAGCVVCGDAAPPMPSYSLADGWTWPEDAAAEGSHGDFSVLHDAEFANLPGMPELRARIADALLEVDVVPARELNLTSKQVSICPGCQQYIDAVEATADLNPWKEITATVDAANEAFCSPFGELPFAKYWEKMVRC